MDIEFCWKQGFITSQLSKYLDRSYWEKKNAENKIREPTAPVTRDSAQPSAIPNGVHYYESDGGAAHKVWIRSDKLWHHTSFVLTAAKVEIPSVNK